MIDWWMVHCLVEQGKEKEDGESSLHDVIKKLFRQNKKKHFSQENVPKLYIKRFCDQTSRVQVQDAGKKKRRERVCFILYDKKYVVSFFVFKMRRLRRIV